MPAVPVMKLVRDEAVSETIQRKTQVIQMAPPAIDMEAGEGALEASLNRKNMVDRIYAQIKKDKKQGKFTTLEAGLAFLRDVATGPAYSQFKAAGGPEQSAMTKEIMARVFHDGTAAAEITPEIRANLGQGLEANGTGKIGDPDITASTTTPGEVASNMTKAKACVITALMFSEGGGVLGASSIEELHFILSTRFKTTWRHYSDDAVFESLYRFMGYTKIAPVAPASLRNLSTAIGTYRSGMASIGGHMIGFKVDSDGLHIRDNDEGLKTPAEHSKASTTVVSVWHK